MADSAHCENTGVTTPLMGGLMGGAVPWRKIVLITVVLAITIVLFIYMYELNITLDNANAMLKKAGLPEQKLNMIGTETVEK